MASTLERSFLKGVVWEIISFFIVIVIVYIVYSNLKTSIIFSLVLTIIKIPLFFIHERVWKHISWGKFDYKRKKR
jgi:adenylylsulfate kinase